MKYYTSGSKVLFPDMWINIRLYSFLVFILIFIIHQHAYFCFFSQHRDVIIRVMVLSELIGYEWEYFDDSPFEYLFPDFREKLKEYKIKEKYSYSERGIEPLQMMYHFIQVCYKILWSMAEMCPKLVLKGFE